MSFVFPNVTVEDSLLLSDNANGFYVNIKSNSSTTADRVVTIDVNNADRLIDLSGNLTLGGNLTTASTVTFTGSDVTFSAAGSTNLTLPASGTLATQAYVDGVAQGLDVKQSVRLATSTSAPWTTTTVMSFSAPTLTLAGLSAGTSLGLVDGVEPVVGNRILVKDGGSASGGTHNTAVQNGIWVVTGGTTTTLTMIRSVDADQDSEVTSGLFCFVEEGTSNSDNGYIVSTPDPITVGVSPFTFTQFSGAGQITAGDGLAKTDNTLSVDLAAASGLEFNAGKLQVNTKTQGGIVLESGELAVDLSANSITGTLGIADGGTGATTLEGANIVTQSTAAAGANFIPVSASASRAIKTTNVSIDGSNNVGGVVGLTMTGALTLGTGNAVIVNSTAQTAVGNTATIPDMNNVADTFVLASQTQILANKTLTLPSINDTSADHQYVFAVDELEGDRTIELPLLTTDDTFVFEAHIQTLSNKTLTLPSINDTLANYQYVFAVNELTADRTVTLPLLTTNDTFVFEAHTQTLSNKTLTNPIINNTIFDVNNNELLRFGVTASAINDITITNAATGTNPVISASGDNTNIGINFLVKGTGNYNFLGNGTTSAVLRLNENTANGTNYVGLAAPASVTGDYTLTFPAALGSAGQVLQNTGSGVLGWVSVATANRRNFSIVSTQLSVTSNTSTIVAYFPFDDSLYGSATSINLIAWIAPTTLSGATVSLEDQDGAITSVALAANATPGIQSSSVAYAPGADKRLVFRVTRTGAPSQKPDVFGIALEMS